MGAITYAGQYVPGADQALVDILTKAAEASGLNVEFPSGVRKGDPRQHGKGNAVDITLRDPANGNAVVKNYQNAASFRTYEQFAQAARQIQRQDYPDLTQKFRWGGYFSGPVGK